MFTTTAQLVVVDERAPNGGGEAAFHAALATPEQQRAVSGVATDCLLGKAIYDQLEARAKEEAADAAEA